MTPPAWGGAGSWGGSVTPPLEAGSTTIDIFRNASDARAGEGCKPVAGERDRFARLVARNPYFARQVMSIMAERLRHHVAHGG